MSRGVPCAPCQREGGWSPNVGSHVKYPPREADPPYDGRSWLTDEKQNRIGECWLYEPMCGAHARRQTDEDRARTMLQGPRIVHAGDTLERIVSEQVRARADIDAFDNSGYVDRRAFIEDREKGDLRHGVQAAARRWDSDLRKPYDLVTVIRDGV